MTSLADLHPVAVARTWLLTRSRVTDLLGGSDGIGVRNEPPYPCLVLSDPPGDDRFGRHLIAPLLQIEVMGDLDGNPGRNALRSLYYTVLEELVLLPEQPTDPADPFVVTEVVPTGGGGYVPLPTRQPRYLGTVRMFMHPRPVA